MQTILAVVAAAVAAVLVGWWLLGGPLPVTDTPAAAGPQVLGIEFPGRIDADGEYVRGTVRFRAPTGTLTHAQFDVVEAGFFQDFGFDPLVEGVKEGEFEFWLASIVPQQITLSVTLTDDAGQPSKAKTFSFVVVEPTELPGGDGF